MGGRGAPAPGADLAWGAKKLDIREFLIGHIFNFAGFGHLTTYVSHPDKNIIIYVDVVVLGSWVSSVGRA